MAHAENTVTIDRPTKDVYQFVLDGTNSPLWRSSVSDVTMAPGKSLGVGAVFKQGLKGPGGRRIDGDYEVVEAVPDQRIKFQVIAGPARPTGEYRFEASGASTRVIFTLDFKPKGLAFLMNGMIQQSMNGEVGALSDLKTYLESHK
jgi:uncharacterized membrane protein